MPYRRTKTYPGLTLLKDSRGHTVKAIIDAKRYRKQLDEIIEHSWDEVLQHIEELEKEPQEPSRPWSEVAAEIEAKYGPFKRSRVMISHADRKGAFDRLCAKFAQLKKQ